MQAFPNAKDRQDFIKSLVLDKPVPDATFRLAHVLLSNRISNIVVTTNFDELIEKALSIFGTPFLSHEHTSIADQIDFDDPITQIIHVHGTHRYYDLCNLKDEILTRAQYPDNTCVSMSNRLDQLLMNKSPIVVGYGGWQGDIITSAMSRRLYGAHGLPVFLPYNIYWFCFNHQSFDSIPDFIKDHKNVVFVLPKSNPTIDPIDIKSANCLLATTVFDQIIRAGEIEKPLLTRKPLEFFADLLENAFYIPQSDDVEFEDPYDILSIAQRIRKTNLKKLSSEEQQLENLRDWIRVSNYKKAMQILLDLDFETFNTELLQDILIKAKNAIEMISSSNLTPRPNHEIALKVIEKIIKIGEKKDIKSLLGIENYSFLLFRRSSIQYWLDQFKESLESSNSFIEKFKNEDSQHIRNLVIKAKLNVNALMISLGNKREAVDEIVKICQKYKDSTEIEIKKTITYFLLLAATTANEFDIELAKNLYDETIRIIGNEKDIVLKFTKMRALINKAISLEVHGKPENTLGLLKEAIETCGNDSSGFCDMPLAGAYFNLGYKYIQIGCFEDAIKTHSWLVERFKESNIDYIKCFVCDSWNSIGLSWLKLGNREKSIDNFKNSLDYMDRKPEIPIATRIYATIGLEDKGQTKKLLKTITGLTKWNLELLIDSLRQFEPEIDCQWVIKSLQEKMNNM